ncbi:helix-turn-helix transcriptional regulator [Sphingomonas sp. TDK1]|uniref:helix-turn-helix transcriptional regulator n=1 Tax=Sphingomonas sp. TDK1 TaxID=453247 RepID=UPI0007D9F3FD|nr:hypothetical protein [Sphingomonas sp. TDK1]OAN58365.1 hypothetical protein A7X12_04725 [Sphingomonas sp. TDK1]
METLPGSPILPALYGCCDDASRWRSVLDEICAGLGTRSAAVQLYRRCGTLLVHEWQDRDSFSHAHAQEHDRWINNPDNPRLTVDLAKLPRASAVVLTDRERFTPGSAGIRETRHRLAQIGLRGGTGVLLELAPDRYLSLILHRALGDGAELDGRDARFLEEIAPHLQRVAELSAKLHAARAAETAMAGVLDRLRVGIVLSSRLGDVRWRNAAALRMLHQGASMTIVQDRLRGTSVEGRQGLARLLAARPDDRTAAACFHMRDGRHVQALALPLETLAGDACRRWGDAESEVALVLIDPGQAPQLATEPVMALFGLTPAEAQLAVALSQGSSLSEYATHRGVSVGTVRVQMKRILEKTDSRRQADLVGKLYASVIAQLQGELH